MTDLDRLKAEFEDAAGALWEKEMSELQKFKFAMLSAAFFHETGLRPTIDSDWVELNTMGSAKPTYVISCFNVEYQ